MTEAVIFVAAICLIAPGILMALVPMLPALSYMFVVALVFAAVNGFNALTGAELLWLLAITAVSIVIDHTSGLLGAKYGGAHTKSLLWGALAGILGTFVMPPFGTFAGLFLGVLVAEIYYKKSHGSAIKAAGGALVGSLVGVLVNVLLAIAFLAAFILLARV